MKGGGHPWIEKTQTGVEIGTRLRREPFTCAAVRYDITQVPRILAFDQM
jgi:hypothetical protein